MNLGEVIKEYEQLQTSVVKTDNDRKFQPTPVGKADNDRKFVTQSSFERLVVPSEEYADHNDVVSSRDSGLGTPPSSSQNAGKMMKVIPPPSIQQTSVITANNSLHAKPCSGGPRKVSMHRQSRIEEGLDSGTESGDFSGEKIFHKEASRGSSPTMMYKNIPHQSSFDYAHNARTAYEKTTKFQKYRSHSYEGHHPESYKYLYGGGENGGGDPMAARIPSPKMRLYKTGGSSFESDDQTAYYMNGLHISPTQHYYPPDQPPYGSIHGSSRESLLDSPTSSIRGSAARRGVPDSQYDVMLDSTGPPPGPPGPPSAGMRSPRTYESQHHRQYKYCQRRAISLNTAPYHQAGSDQNIRRILSEETVAENPLIDCMRRAESSNSAIRRASSFDDFGRDPPSVRDSHYASYGGGGHGGENENKRPLQQHTNPSIQQPPTKIMFPEDAMGGPKDHGGPHPHDDASHPLSVNRLVGDKGGPYLQQDHEQACTGMYRYTPPPLLAGYSTSATATSQQQQQQEKENKNDTTKHTTTSTAKTKTTKGGQFDNFVIGPYEYDPEKDDDVAVNVSGLLTLPGSNEKR